MTCQPTLYPNYYNQPMVPSWYLPEFEMPKSKYESILKRETPMMTCPPEIVNAQMKPWWCQPEMMNTQMKPYWYPTEMMNTQMKPLYMPEMINSQMMNPTECSFICNVNCRPTNMTEFYCLTNPIRVLDREGNRQIYLCFDMKCFRPEEVQVTLNKTERCILIEATHEVKDCKEHQVTRKFVRKVQLPQSLSKVDLTKCELKCCLNVEGQLTVECPLPKMTPEEIKCEPTLSKQVYSPYQHFCPTVPSNPVNTKVC
jgi:HSP20 family molecular chaperone IbpA